MNKLKFSFDGKSVAAEFATLASIQTVGSPQAFAAASAIAFRGTGSAEITKTAAAETTGKLKKLSKSQKDSVGEMARQASDAIDAIDTIESSKSNRDSDRLGEFNETTLPFFISRESNVVTVPTATLIVSEHKASVRRAIVTKLRKKFGMKTIEEGALGKVLLRAPEDGLQGIQIIQECIQSYPTGFDAISPNFFRVREHRRIDSGASGFRATAMAASLPWSLQNLGVPGIAGADVKAIDAWAITKGDSRIRVAVLDEGVDVNHPSLRDAIVDSKDFSNNRSDSSPDGNDAHGTACAGIIASRDAAYPGLAPNISLIGARIARSSPSNPALWLFDDFNTADAIDWCWDDAKADVLSNSWGGGPPSDAIRLAFERARTLGRSGKGCVIAIAAGNTQSAIPFPGTLPAMLVVGASNQWDKRKTKNSQDGENWWGSCFGPTMGLVAPGVRIKTTDISGTAGYTNTDFVEAFNGTSSATPYVAAAAGLVLSVNSSLTEEKVRKILTTTCDPIAGSTAEVGAGRLNVGAALEKAQKSLLSNVAASSVKKKVKKGSKAPKPTTKTIAAKTSTKPAKKASKKATKKKGVNKKARTKVAKKKAAMKS